VPRILSAGGRAAEQDGMDIYTFVVEHFIIHDTRALHNDTLTLYYSAFVDGDLVASHLISMGDFDNGEYSVVDYVPSDQSPGLVVVINDPAAKVAFNFQLVNAGNPPGGSLAARLASVAQAIFSSATGLKGAGATEVLAALDGSASVLGLLESAGLMQAFSTLWSWLSADCDGPVAVDQISGPRYVLDAWTDNSARAVRARGRMYPGLDSPHGCGGNSNYELNWSLQHARTWVAVKDPTNKEFIADTGLSAAEHYGAVHAFGVVDSGTVNRARTFTGATWYIDTVGSFNLAALPVSSVSFNDRLYLFGVQANNSIACLAFTIDGTTWISHAATPPALTTKEPVALAVFRDRLFMLARDPSSQLHLTSTSDLRIWTSWVQVPSPGLQPSSALAAATLAGKLFIFGVFKTRERPVAVVMRNSTSDGVNWSGWQEIEGGLYPEEGKASDYPLDVAATTFKGRLYIASRWLSPPPDPEHEGTTYLAVNFSEDGDDWCGWRIPPSDIAVLPNKSAGIAAVDDHLYLFVPRLFPNIGQGNRVWAY
jgi:hypothetical protein